MEVGIYKFVVCFCIVFTPLQTSSTQDVPEEFRAKIKIVGGRVAERDNWSYQAVVVIMKTYDPNITICGGTLISPLWILTSAYCVSNYSGILVFLGAWNLSRAEEPGREVHSVERTVLHPCNKYGEFSGANLGLIKLSTAALKTPACLPVSHTADWNYISSGGTLNGCTATGFGQTGTMPEFNNLLHEISFSIVNRGKCLQAYPNYPLSKDKICAYGHEGRATCGGDDGGPLICRSSIRERCNGTYIAAVTLAGEGTCGSENHPSIYNAIFPHVEWINAVIRGTINRKVVTCDIGKIAKLISRTPKATASHTSITSSSPTLNIIVGHNKK